MKRASGVVAALLLSIALPFEAQSGEACCNIVSVDTRSGVVNAQDKSSRRAFQFRVENAIQLQKLRPGQAVDADFAAGKVSVDGIPGRHPIVGSPPPAPQAAQATIAQTPPSIAQSPPPAQPQPQRPAAPPTLGTAPPPQSPQPQTRPSPTIPPSIGSTTSSGAPGTTIASTTPQPSPQPQPAQRGGPTIGGGTVGAGSGGVAGAPGLSHGAAGGAKPGEACCDVVAVDTRGGIVTARENASKRTFGIKVDNAILLNRIRVGQDVEADFNAGKAGFQGISGRFAIVAAPTGATAASEREPARGPSLGGPAPDRTSSATPSRGEPSRADPTRMARATPRKTYALPAVTVGAPEARTNTRVGGLQHAAVGRGVRQLRDMDEIESSSLPESAKIMMMMHALTLPENTSDHYIVDEEMAREWAKAHKVPEDMKPKKKKKKKKKKCDWTHSGGCWDKVEQTAQDLWDQASEDWKRAWRSNTKNLAERWEEVEECFADHTIKAGNIPVKFDIAPQFPVSLERASSGSGSSGSVKGTLTVGLPVEADFKAEIELFYIPCMPFAIRPKSIGADGTMTVAAKLGAQVLAQGAFNKEYTIPPGGGPAIPIAVLPIVIGGIPVATLDVALYVDGTVRVGGDGQLDGRFGLLAPYRSDFDFECSGRGCRGRMKNVPVPTTATENVVLKGKVHVQPAIYTALQLSINFDALSARAGPQPFLYGEVRGCSATAAMQSSSGQSSMQEYHALSADLDWGIELRAEALVAGEQVKEYVKEVMQRKHLWFGDIAPGGSTAMSPGLKGPAQVAVGAAAEFQFASRPCYPYSDAVEYRVTWAGGATPSAAPAGARTVSMRPGAHAGSGDCDWSAAGGSCTLKPGANGSVHLAWPQAGAHSVTVTPLRDQHGREFKAERATQLSVSVQ